MTDKNTEDLRSRVPDSVPDCIDLFERNGTVFGRDEHGEFELDPMRGADEPPDDRCGAPLTYYEDRYGQIRYCTGMPENTFVDGGSDFCRMHKSREALIERAHELFEHGYFATNYVNFAEKLDATKFIFAVQMLDGLFEMSDHDFNITRAERVIDTSNSGIIREDSAAVELPIPRSQGLQFQANELWMAALDEVKVQNMQEAIFTQGMEARTIAASADVEGQITDTVTEKEEHHLHLPVSRLTKDIKEHLKNGGVDVDGDDSAAITFEQRDYTLDVQPDDDAESADDVAEEFSEAMEITE
jgi:hypothetical protein